VPPHRAPDASGLKTKDEEDNPVGKTLHYTFLGLVSSSLLFGSFLAGGCGKNATTICQGYVEGEFVYVASPFGGQLQSLAVKRGDSVQMGAQLFTLDSSEERALAEKAAALEFQAKSNVADLSKGERPSELLARESKIEQAKASENFAALELERGTRLRKTDSIAIRDYDSYTYDEKRNKFLVLQAQAELATAKLGGRLDAIAAAEAFSRAAAAELQAAIWRAAQKTQASPKNALVYDTLYREGEWVPAGRPVVALLPPENVKLRFFVSETIVNKLSIGQKIKFSVSGRNEELKAVLSYVKNSPEFTPPVIYSREVRSKLVFMVEAALAPEIARTLHPGQPIDVELVP